MSALGCYIIKEVLEAKGILELLVLHDPYVFAISDPYLKGRRVAPERMTALGSIFDILSKPKTEPKNNYIGRSR